VIFSVFKITNIKKRFFVTCGILLIISNVGAQNYRYAKSIFSETIISTDIVYGLVPFLNFPYTNESSTTIRELKMDIYQPKDDGLNNRPAIIFAHGGGFVTGFRDVDDMIALCDSFAQKGYVTATIDYRQGVEVVDNSNLHYTRTAYRGLQDGRAAIRFLRANAETYGINPNEIYWGGNSAGSFIGLNCIYLDENEKPSYADVISYTNPLFPFNTINTPDLGGLDLGSNLSFSGGPNAVMALWGGVSDTLIIEAENNQAVFLIHGTDDLIVPFNSGPPFSLYNIALVYGSNSINTRLNNIGIPASETYFVQGEGHEFYGVFNGNLTNELGGNAYWDTIIQRATSFYWQQHKPIANFNYVVNDFRVDFSNLSSEATS
jgi:acetyl esterase/lipase